MRLAVVLLLFVALTAQAQQLPDAPVVQEVSKPHFNPFKPLYDFKHHTRRTEYIWMGIGGVVGLFVYRQQHCNEKYYYDNGVKEPYVGVNVPCPKNTY